MELTTAQFFVTLISAILIYYPESGNHELQPSDTAENDLLQAYDFIIVGAGSAGCVVTNRLTENPEWKVLLVEAGGDEDAISETPLLQSYLQKSEKDWNYTTVKQNRACLGLDGICNYPRGHVMGGSSTINAMMYVRGNRADYDAWSKAGNQGWSYNDVLPYFVKAENNTAPELKSSSFHGHNGYLNVGHAMYLSPLVDIYFNAGKEFGWKEGDYNGEKQDRMGLLQFTMDGPSRESTSKAYLNPIRKRKNLHVVKHAVVTKLLIKDKVANGIEYYKNGVKHRSLVKKEVIISAGAINTPKLLMLSGIGPKEELMKHNITVLSDLPVGKNLQDHLFFSIYFEIEKKLTLLMSQWKTKDSVIEYAKYKEGPLTTNGAEVMTFLNVLDKNYHPNLQVIFSCTNGNIKASTDNKQILTILLSNVHPKSVGSVRLKSANWTDTPLIDPNYFHENIDFEVFEKGFQLVQDFMKTPTMSSLSPKLYTENYIKCPISKFGATNRYVKCIIENYTATIFHPVGTAKMGPKNNEDTVVTPDLLVKGFLNLRVIDASIMPNIIRGNTNAPTIMIAEKGADIIKEFYSYKY